MTDPLSRPPSSWTHYPVLFCRKGKQLASHFCCCLGQIVQRAWRRFVTMLQTLYARATTSFYRKFYSFYHRHESLIRQGLSEAAQNEPEAYKQGFQGVLDALFRAPSFRAQMDRLGTEESIRDRLTENEKEIMEIFREAASPEFLQSRVHALIGMLLFVYPHANPQSVQELLGLLLDKRVSDYKNLNFTSQEALETFVTTQFALNGTEYMNYFQSSRETTRFVVMATIMHATNRILQNTSHDVMPRDEAHLVEMILDPQLGDFGLRTNLASVEMMQDIVKNKWEELLKLFQNRIPPLT